MNPPWLRRPLELNRTEEEEDEDEEEEEEEYTTSFFKSAENFRGHAPE